MNVKYILLSSWQKEFALNNKDVNNIIMPINCVAVCALMAFPFSSVSNIVFRFNSLHMHNSHKTNNKCKVKYKALL